jgi:hypothetical protein
MNDQREQVPFDDGCGYHYLSHYFSYAEAATLATRTRHPPLTRFQQYWRTWRWLWVNSAPSYRLPV